MKPKFDSKNVRRFYLNTTQKIKNFLLSDKCREFLIFLFFFVIAAAFWLLQTLNSDYEVEFSIPVRLKDVPEDVVITSEPISNLKINVKDRGTVLLNYMLAKNFIPINLDFDDYEHSHGRNSRVKVHTSELTKKVSSQLNASTKLLSVSPDSVDFIYSRGAGKMVPVRLVGKIAAERQFYIADTICSPDSVLVYAPENLLGSIQEVVTQKVKFENIADTVTYSVKLKSVKGTKFVPDVVDFTFPVDIYTEKTLEIPIEGINLPSNKILYSFPPRAKITFQVGMSKFRDIQKEDFIVGLLYKDIKDCVDDKCIIRLIKQPKGISNVRINPANATFLIENVSK